VVAGLGALLALGLVAAGAGCSDSKGDDDGGGTPGGAGAATTSTTINAGDVDVSAPEGWQVIPVPDLGFGLAVPPGWEATLLSPEGLATLAGASPRVPDFTELAHAAAEQGGVLYAAGVDRKGGVTDVVVRGAPAPDVKDTADLQRYAEELARQAGRPDQEVTVVDGADHPTVQVRFQVGGAGGDEAQRSEATETLVAAPNGVVWDVTVTSDDAASHDALARQLTETFTLAPAA
jgi:hypothetical protein